MVPDLLFFLLIGHYFGDFAFQTDRMAKEKGNSPLILTQHVLIYVACIAISLFIGMTMAGNSDFFTLLTLLAMIAIFVEHWLQDFIKCSYNRAGKQGWYLDQGLHVLVLYALRLFLWNS